MHSQFIDELGGPKAVADEVRERRGSKSPSNQAVSMWKQRGVPWRQRRIVADMANRLGVSLPEGFLDDTEKAAA